MNLIDLIGWKTLFILGYKIQNLFKVTLGFNIKEDNYCKFLGKYNFWVTHQETSPLYPAKLSIAHLTKIILKETEWNKWSRNYLYIHAIDPSLKEVYMKMEGWI